MWSVDAPGAHVAAGSARKPIARPSSPPRPRSLGSGNSSLSIRERGFVDLRVPPVERLKIAKPKGYIGRHGGKSEYWLTGTRFEAIVGGKAEALELEARTCQARSSEDLIAAAPG